MSYEIELTNSLLNYLDKGGVQKNPAFNPKTKKGREQPKYIKAPVPTREDDYVGSILNASNNLYYDNNKLGMSTDEVDSDIEKGAIVGPAYTARERQIQKANNQYGITKLFNGLARGVVAEAGIGTIKGFSDIVDIVTNAFSDEPNDYTNHVSSYLKSLQEDINNYFNIERKNPGETLEFSDAGWWGEGIANIFSTVSLLLPSKAITSVGKIPKIASWLGKGNMGLAKMLKAANVIEKENKVAKMIGVGSDLIGTSAIMRTIENYQEAREVYKASYDENLEQLNAMNAEQRDVFFKNNPQFVNMKNDEIARKMASDGAYDTFISDYALLPIDIMQLRTISSLWKGAANRYAGSALRIANRNAKRELVGKAIEEINFLNRSKEVFRNIVKSPLRSAASDFFGEGFEEIYQGITNEKGKEYSKFILNPKHTERTISSYLQDEHIWEQGFWGAIGGLMFPISTNLISKGIDNIKDLYNKNVMTEKEYEQYQLSKDKMREVEINGRRAIIDSYIDAVNKIKSGKSVFHGDEDVDIDENQQQEQMKAITEQYIGDMAIAAIENGNYELFKDYMQSDEFKKYISDKTQDDNLIELFSEIGDNHFEDYSNIINDIHANVEDAKPYVAKLMARSILRDNRVRRVYEDMKKEIDDKINKNISDGDFIYKDRLFQEAYSRVISTHVKELRDELNKAKDDYKNGIVSKQGLNQYYRDYRDKLKKLKGLNEEFMPGYFTDDLFVEDNELDEFSDDTKTIDDTVGKLDSLLENINKDDSNNNEESKNISKRFNELNETIKRYMYDKANMEIEYELNIKKAPVTNKEINDEYKEFDEIVNEYVTDRLNNSFKRLTKYLENIDDIDGAFAEIMKGNIPEEYKDDLLALKLGHTSTINYTMLLSKFYKKLKAKKEKEEMLKSHGTINGRIVSEQESKRLEETLYSAAEEVDSGATIQTSPPSTGKEEKTNEDNKTTNDNFIDDNDGIIATEIKTEPIYDSDTHNNNLETKTYYDDDNHERDNLAMISKNREAMTNIVINIIHSNADNIRNAMNNGTYYEYMNSLKEIIKDGIKKLNIIEGDDVDKIIDDFIIETFPVYIEAIKRKINKNIDSISVAQKASIFSTLVETPSKFEQILNDAIIGSAKSIRGEDKKVINILDVMALIIKNSKTFNSERLTEEDVTAWFYYIKDFVEANKEEYKFKNKAALDNIKIYKNLINELNDLRNNSISVKKNFHIATSTTLSTEAHNALKHYLYEGNTNGYKVIVSSEIYNRYKGNNDAPSSIPFYIIDKDGNVIGEIGYVAGVVMVPNGNGYEIYRQKSGLKSTITKTIIDSDIVYEFNEDIEEMFNDILKEDSKAFQILQAINLRTEVIKNGRVGYNPPSNSIIEEVIDAFRKDERGNDVSYEEIIKYFIGDKKLSDILVSDGAYDRKNLKTLISKIYNIVYYTNNSFIDLRQSYNSWKKSVYDNYDRTYALQKQLEKEDVEVNLSSEDDNTLITTDEPVNISELPFIKEQHKVVIVGKDGLVIDGDNSRYVTNLSSGTAGILVSMRGDNGITPIVSVIRTTIKFNGKIKNAFDKHLKSLLDDYLNGVISFEKLRNDTNNMINIKNGDINSTGIIRGAKFITIPNNAGFIIELGANKILIYNKDINGNDTKRVIVETASGKSDYSQSSEESFDKVKEITANGQFNIFAHWISGRNKSESNNPHVFIRGDKYIIKFGNEEFVYDSYLDYLIDNKIAMLNQGYKNGSFFHDDSIGKSLYVDIKLKGSSPVEDGAYKDMNAVANEKLAGKNNNKNSMSVDTLRKFILFLYGNKHDKKATILSLIDNNEVAKILLFSKGIKLGVQNIAYGSYNSEKDIVTINRTMFQKNNFISNRIEFIRTLMHENIHRQMNIRRGDFDFNGFENAMIKLMNEFEDAIEGSNIETKDIIIKRINALNEAYGGNRAILAEEWFVEALTNKTILEAMNSITYTGEKTIYDSAKNNNKSFFMKLLEWLYELFNIKVKDETYLAEQYAIVAKYLYDEKTNNKETNNENENQMNVEHKKDNATDENINADIENIEDNNDDSNDDNNDDDLTITIDTIEDENDNDDGSETIIDENEFDDLFSNFASLDEYDVYDNAIDRYKSNNEVNIRGIRYASDMETFLLSVPSDKRAELRSKIERGDFIYSCR